MNFYLFYNRTESHLNLQKADQVVEKHKYPSLVASIFKKG